ncbi:hypothetical protein EYB25_002558 [Talaromyces marneffei]|uniref:uncharacterized protein n=1 Tax=Talaromyces marneffei TaxID=37727 RepID=UPI0012A9990A|nr:uncharacterized protein EYB26_002575 [Talaromyces marneffei]KAE8554020.1 hypothetical protein EYB25_002558 [Talaromyces marneffei]QGA14919.1 hypothetical protein EYB26_002575 [Talaromyces marneffei]
MKTSKDIIAREVTYYVVHGTNASAMVPAASPLREHRLRLSTTDLRTTSYPVRNPLGSLEWLVGSLAIVES